MKAAILNIVGLALSLGGSIVLAWELCLGTLSLERFRRRMTKEMLESADKTTLERLFIPHRRQTWAARIGIGLILLGFAAQLVAAILSLAAGRRTLDQGR